MLNFLNLSPKTTRRQIDHSFFIVYTCTLCSFSMFLKVDIFWPPVAWIHYGMRSSILGYVIHRTWVIWTFIAVTYHFGIFMFFLFLQSCLCYYVCFSNWASLYEIIRTSYNYENVISLYQWYEDLHADIDYMVLFSNRKFRIPSNIGHSLLLQYVSGILKLKENFLIQTLW